MKGRDLDKNFFGFDILKQLKITPFGSGLFPFTLSVEVAIPIEFVNAKELDDITIFT